MRKSHRFTLSVLWYWIVFLCGGVALPCSTGVICSVAAEDSFVPFVAEPVLGEPTPQNLSGFRKNLIKAAEQSFSDKEISRLDLFRIRVASMNPAVLRKMHQACAEQVLSEKKVGSYGAIDWDKLLAFIKEILPIILELIKMFAYAPHYSPHWYYAGAVMPGLFCGEPTYRDLS